MISRADLLTLIAKAESACTASLQATRTHGHQAITWACLKADIEELAALRARLAEMKEDDRG